MLLDSESAGAASRVVVLGLRQQLFNQILFVLSSFEASAAADVHDTT